MTLDEVTATIAAITYKPGWSFTVARTPWCPRLVVEHPYGDAEWVPLPLMSMRSMTPRLLARWVLSGVHDLETRTTSREFRCAGRTVEEMERP